MSVRGYLTTVVVSAVLATAFVAPTASASADSTVSAEGSRMKNGTGLCLDGSFSKGVRLMDCNASSAYQQWSFGSINSSIYNMAYSNIPCLDGSLSRGVRLAECEPDSDYKHFTFNQRTGQYVSFADPRYCLDGSRSQGVRLALCDKDSGYQNWTFP
jgi:ricin-type beta-trefoil lectin protein